MKQSVSCSHEVYGWLTYDHLGFVRESTRADAEERVVVLAFAQCGCVNIRGEEADGRQHSRIECSLTMDVSTCIIRTLWQRIHGRPNVGESLQSVERSL